MLDQMHAEACVEVSQEQKQHVIDLERRLASLLAGPPTLPGSINLGDVLPQGKLPQEICQRLEDHCLLVETLNKSRVLLKDLFRTYASSSLTQVNSLDTMEIDEFRVFCKDNRCSQRALSKLPQIFATANSHSEDGNDDKDNNPSDGLVLAEFVECIVRVAREQIPGKDHLPKKLQMFLQNVQRHSKVASREATPLMNEVSVSKVIKKRDLLLRKIFTKYAEADKADLKQSTMNLKELYALMKDCNQMDSKFSISKLATAFIAANSCSEVGDNGTWNDWDWELEYEEYVEAIVRIVDMKTKTAEGVLSDKVEDFCANVLAKFAL